MAGRARATQQAGTAYAGGERDPKALAGEAGKGAGIGLLAGFLGGLLPAKSLTPLQRAVAQANLEAETAELRQVLQRVSGLSRQGQEATRRLAQVHAKLAELEGLSSPAGRGAASTRAAAPAAPSKALTAAEGVEAIRARKAAAKTELDAAHTRWYRKYGGRLYSGIDPEAVADALPVARALVKHGVASADELVTALEPHLKGHSAEFRRAVVGALEKEDGPIGKPQNPLVPFRTAGDPGRDLLAKAVARPGAHQQFSFPVEDGAPKPVRWYEVGRRWETRAEREAMVDHLEAEHPAWVKKKWTVLGHKSGTLRELITQSGVVPAEVGELYAPRGSQGWQEPLEAFQAEPLPRKPGTRAKLKRKIGLVEPGGVPAPWSAVHWLEPAGQPAFPRSLDTYSQITRPIHNLGLPWGLVGEAAEMDQVVQALHSGKVRFHVIDNNLHAGIWKMTDPKTGETYYHLQANPFADPTGKVRRHELLHLAALPKGQKEYPRWLDPANYPHEMSVSWATTPGNAVMKTAGLTVVGGIGVAGGLWAKDMWDLNQSNRLQERNVTPLAVRKPKPKEPTGNRPKDSERLQR